MLKQTDPPSLINQRPESVVELASRLHTVIEALSEPLVAYDHDRRVLLANQPFYALLGFDPDHSRLEGLSLDELGRLSPTLGQRGATAALDTVLRRQPVDTGTSPRRLEVELCAPKCIYQLVESAMRGEGGDIQGHLVIYHDVTQLRESERVKDELVAVLSHELRTPLTSILGYAKLLVDGKHASPVRRAKWASFILDKSRVLARLIDEVLDLSRLSMQRVVLDRQPTDIVELVARTIDEVAVTTETHSFIIEAPDDLPRVTLDAQHVGQVLTNLLDNAVKFWPDGGAVRVAITLDTSDEGRRTKNEGREAEDVAQSMAPNALHAPHPTPPTLSPQPSAFSTHFIRISVIDRGPGVPPDQHETIFEPFHRVDHQTTRRAYGLGLGLALCKGIVEAHGGSIGVIPAEGGGSVFYFTLPLRADDDPNRL